MTGFAQDRSAGGGISHPIISRDAGRVHANIEHGRPARFLQLLLEISIRGRKAAIESHRELASGRLCGVIERATLLHGERHGLLDKHVLASLQRGNALGCVALVSADDNDDVNIGVL